MKIRFLKTVSGNDFVYKKGQEVELSNELATGFLNAKHAEAVEVKATKRRTTRKK